jgi:hypothetical protein
VRAQGRVVTGALVQGEDGLWRESSPDPAGTDFGIQVLARYAGVVDGAHWFRKADGSGYLNGTAFALEVRERFGLGSLKVATVWRRIDSVLLASDKGIRRPYGKASYSRDPDGEADLAVPKVRWIL